MSLDFDHILEDGEPSHITKEERNKQVKLLKYQVKVIANILKRDELYKQQKDLVEHNGGKFSA